MPSWRRLCQLGWSNEIKCGQNKLAEEQEEVGGNGGFFGWRVL